MSESKVDKSQKSTDIEHKNSKKQDQTQALTVTKEDLEGTQKELDAALVIFGPESGSLWLPNSF